MNKENHKLQTISKIALDIFIEVFVSLVFLAAGAALLPILYQFITAADQWVVVVAVFVTCVGLSVLMAKIFDQ